MPENPTGLQLPVRIRVPEGVQPGLLAQPWSGDELPFQRGQLGRRTGEHDSWYSGVPIHVDTVIGGAGGGGGGGGGGG